MEKYTLKLNEFSLIFKRDENDWTEVILDLSSHTIKLGADTFIGIQKKWNKMISENSNEIVGKLDNLPVSSCFSLFENHHTIYFNKGENLSLFFQNEKNEIYFKTIISKQENHKLKFPEK
jgi:hypothetical protein